MKAIISTSGLAVFSLVLLGLVWVATVATQMTATAPQRLAYFTGNDYRKLSDLARSTYVAGLADGISHAFAGTSPDTHAQWTQCLRERPYGQLRAMLDRHLDAHPEDWHYGAPGLFYKTVAAACRLPTR